MPLVRPSSTGTARPTSAAASTSSPAMIQALVAGVGRTITGNDVTTFSDSGAELQGSIDTTGTPATSLATCDLILFEPPSGAVISADPAASWIVEVTTNPGTGANVWFVFGFGYAANVAAFDPATDDSIWWSMLLGPGANVGTTANAAVKTNNANPGTSSNMTTFWGASCALLNAGGKRPMAPGRALYNSLGASNNITNSTMYAGTSSHLLIPFCGFGHKVVGLGSEVLGVTARYSLLT